MSRRSPRMVPDGMTDADVIEAIRKRHLKANIDHHERDALADKGQHATVHWERAWIDPGFPDEAGNYFWPYLKVPITLRFGPPINHGPDTDEIVVRVYPPERLRKQIAKRWRRSPRIETTQK